MDIFGAMTAHITPVWGLKSILSGILLTLLCGCSPTTGPSVHFYPVKAPEKSCDLPKPANFHDAFREMRFSEIGDMALSQPEIDLNALAIKVLFAPDAEALPSASQGLLLDSLVLHHWMDLLQAKAWQTDQFAHLDSLARMDPTSSPEDLILPAAFAKADGLPKFIFERDTFSIPITRSTTHSPVVEVEVNGKKYNFWVDTGAAVTVLSSDLAELVGISYLNEGLAEIGTSTRRKVQTQPALLDSIRIGAFRADNHPCVVMDKKDLTFRFLGIRVLKIDGIIGWPLIKEMDVDINMPANLLTIRKPVVQGNQLGNLGWYCQPFLYMQTPGGCVLNLQLDTGSQTTFFRPRAYQKLGRKPEGSGPLVQGGAGGKEIVRFDKLDSCQFILGDHLVQMDYAEGIKQTSEKDGIFVFDGVLGQNILKHGILRLDFTNRLFRFSHQPRETSVSE